MNWKQQWINQVLADIPAGSYRRRMENELCDHLETQLRALMESGRTEAEAQAEAMEAMGAPDRLREEYRAAWRRSWPGRLETVVTRLGAWSAGCAIMGGLYILTFVLLGLVGFAYDATFSDRISFPLLSGSIAYITVFSSILFLVPFGLGALFLRRCFYEEPHPARLVTVGLLAAWAGEKAAIIGLSALIYQMPLGLDLLTRIYHGGDTTAPWFTPANYVLTFLGCILLGVVFGRKSVKVERSIAA